jgi:hypothetical protein
LENTELAYCSTDYRIQYATVGDTGAFFIFSISCITIKLLQFAATNVHVLLKSYTLHYRVSIKSFPDYKHLLEEN